MSKSIFVRTNEKVRDVKRNVFDLSFQNNLTMDFGALYPVFCKEVLPGDSFSIKPTFGLNFMPLYFPVQTRMRANLHFFYVRNRNLWKDWMDFFGKTKENLISPYVDASTAEHYSSQLGTGSLGDYLGVPSTVVGDYNASILHPTLDYRGNKAAFTVDAYLPDSPPSTVSAIMDLIRPLNAFRSFADRWDAYSLLGKWVYVPNLVSLRYRLGRYVNAAYQTFSFGMDITNVVNDSNSAESICYYLKYMFFLRAFDSSTNEGSELIIQPYSVSAPDPTQPNQIEVVFKISNGFNLVHYDELGLYFPRTSAFIAAGQPEGYLPFALALDSDGALIPAFSSTASLAPKSDDTSLVVDLSYNNTPFYSSINTTGQKLSVLPFRAYESIYNAFYRDIRNNPYLINGVPEYNKYIPSLEGGADTNVYKLRYRNWEQDFLTTAVQSPQQGIAPLVGLTDSGQIAFTDVDGSNYIATIQTEGVTEDDMAERIVGIDVEPTSAHVSTVNTMVGLATSGISINDFRNVNALQLWLEANNRLGFRYKDQIRAHYDVDIRFDELQMPEFLGGTSEDVSVNQINQQTDSGDMPLGSYAGQARCFGTSDNRISHYFDEPGFVIGIISVSPVPNYSQLLPKHFTKFDPMDYFFPEFGHIGMQAIPYSEVCPAQAFLEGPTVLKDTFGYQRAWYDYLASVDEVHGHFRTDLRNFLINRVFNSKPQLSEDFLLIDPKQTNDVFSVTVGDGKILGQIYFDVTAKRPIPMYGIPRLES